MKYSVIAHTGGILYTEHPENYNKAETIKAFSQKDNKYIYIFISSNPENLKKFFNFFEGWDKIIRLSEALRLHVNSHIRIVDRFVPKKYQLSKEYSLYDNVNETFLLRDMGFTVCNLVADKLNGLDKQWGPCEIEEIANNLRYE